MKLLKHIWYAINPVVYTLLIIAAFFGAILTHIGGLIVLVLVGSVMVTLMLLTIIGMTRDRWRSYRIGTNANTTRQSSNRI